MSPKLSKKDLQQLKEKGISEQTLANQLALLTEGSKPVTLSEAATIGNGIKRFEKIEQERLSALFEEHKDQLDLLKFVPASGAATRMFKFLFQFLDEFNPEKESTNAYINKKDDQDLRIFFVGLDNFPFYDEVRQKLVEIYDDDSDDINKNRLRFVQLLLNKNGFNYGYYPKGLLPFHCYKKHKASSFEEHLFEAALYVKTKGKARLHFTISESHYNKFKDQFERVQQRIEEKTNTVFNCSYSFQLSNTDTIAVHPDNTIYRDKEDHLVFRPGGHGALIENLSNQDADIIFIKNIDNVVVSQYENEIVFYKKMLGGLLIEVQKKSFNYIQLLNKEEVNDDQLLEIVYFLQDQFCQKLSIDFEKFSKKYQIEYLKEQLDRPIRICGMVKNEGEPGGGPFWVKHDSGTISLQIVESNQINTKEPVQKHILQSVSYTHLTLPTIYSV